MSSPASRRGRRSAAQVARSVLESLDRVPPEGDALDVAMGRGRHALELAARGFNVVGLDNDRRAMAEARRRARERGLELDTWFVDLEAEGARLPEDEFDLVLVVNFLWRPLMPALERALRPGGHLLYETFTRRQAEIGRPTNPDYLLEPGELRQTFSRLEILHCWEGLTAGPAHRAHLLARRSG
jgi:SAM-dependent methyltransferase